MMTYKYTESVYTFILSSMYQKCNRNVFSGSLYERFVSIEKKIEKRGKLVVYYWVKEVSS